MRHGFKILSAALLGSLFGLSSPSMAAIISVDINGYSPQAARFGPDAVGLTFSGVAQIGSALDVWNGMPIADFTTNTLTAPSLKLTDGTTVTTVSFTVTAVSQSSPYLFQDKIVADWSSGNDLMTDYLVVASATNATFANFFGGIPEQLILTIAGLNPGGTYDLHLIGGQGTSHRGVFTFGATEVTASSGYSLNTASFVGLTANVNGVISGTLDANPVTELGLFNGFQIEGAFPIPEPASMSVLGLIGVGLMGRRRV